jgi:hypothetical protein
MVCRTSLAASSSAVITDSICCRSTGILRFCKPEHVESEVIQTANCTSCTALGQLSASTVCTLNSRSSTTQFAFLRSKLVTFSNECI